MVKRYDISCFGGMSMDECADGAYVNYEDYAELESKLETALRECRSAGITIDNLEAKCAALDADNKKAMEAMRQADAAVKLAHEKFSALAEENALMDELDKWKQESSAWQAVAEKQLALAEDAEKRITELEAREVVLPRAHDVHPLGPQSAKIFCEFHRSIVNRCADEIRKVGVKVSIKGN